MEECKMSHQVGGLAPEFHAKAYCHKEFQTISSAQYRGKWVCLFFYPLDFTFVCPTEIRAFAEKEAEFAKANCQILGCSTDSEHCHKAWFERDLPEVKFPILADTAHQIASSYGVLLEDKGIALRGTFLIDPKGVLQWMTVNALDVGRSVDEVLRTLQALQTGSLCPADWRPGKATLS